MGHFISKLQEEGKTLEANFTLKGQRIKDVLIALKMESGHIHCVLPSNEDIKTELIEDLRSDLPIPVRPPETNQPPKEVIFRNRQAIGDILMMSCLVRDFKKQFPNTRIGVQTTAMNLWLHNPNIDHTFRSGPKPLKVGPSFGTNRSNLWNFHMANAFRLDVEQKLNVSIEQGKIAPDIWMTEEEYKRPPIINGNYWVMIYGGEPGWPSKCYGRWQEAIDIITKSGIKVVQLGVSKHPYPILNRVVNYVGKTEDKDTGIRDLFNIFLHSQGSIGLVSMHMHLSAAFGNPAVVVAGAREPQGFTQYVNHQYISNNGCLPCAFPNACWACKLEGCKNLVIPEKLTEGHPTTQIPKCVDLIEPEEIAEAVRKYYKGGRLEYGKKIPNKFFKNVTKEAKIFVVPKTKQIDNNYLEKWDFKWGGGSITDQDWIFIKKTLEKYKVKNILEFGAGLSSLLFGTIAKKVVTFETAPGWIKKISELADENVNTFFKWDGKNFSLPEQSDILFDLAFVDGPSGGGNREISTKVASELADIVIVHDAGREPEREWQKKYLAKDFEMISKGGHRCHLWRRRSTVIVDESKPLARMITTTRGWGGSERSTIYIMKGLLEKGYRVELVPTGNIGGEYLNNIPEGVVKHPWGDILKEPSDLTVFYASDTIWNYHKEQYTNFMPYLNTKRKVMVVNYKIGGVGQVEWTLGWDKYMFLNSEHESEVLERIPGVTTKVLAPPTDLTEFFKVQPYYGFPLKLIRHSSQGDNKYRPDNNEIIKKILDINASIQFHFMPPKSDCIDHPQVIKYRKNDPPVYDFLKNGNCFFYLLPQNFTEGGPRTILEAHASSLPVIANNHSGMKDRITDETGWLINEPDEYLEVIKEIMGNPEILRIKGGAARKRAIEEFIPERWIEEIVGDKE